MGAAPVVTDVPANLFDPVLANVFAHYGQASNAFPWRPWWKLFITDRSVRDTGKELYLERIRYDLRRIDGKSSILGAQTLCDSWVSDGIPWDRVRTDVAEIDRLDELEPMEKPPVLAGQTWGRVVVDDMSGSRVFNDISITNGFLTDAHHSVRVSSRADANHIDSAFLLDGSWGLLWGPRAPWAPPSWEWLPKTDA